MEAPVSAVALRVLSMNVFVRPPGINNPGVPSDYKDERLALLRPYLLAYDIVALQEMFAFASSRQSRLLQWARENGYTALSAPLPSIFSGSLVDGALVLLTKHHVVEEAYHSYSRGCGPDRLMDKGCLYAKIKLNNCKEACIHVFNTHTQASYNEGLEADLPNQQVRSTQFEEMRKFILTKTGSDDFPILLVGDFNVNSLSTASPSQYEALCRAMTPPGWTLSDVLFDTLRAHPVTHGETIVDEHGMARPREPVFTARTDRHKQQSLDYLFLLTRPLSPCRLVPRSSSTCPFFVTGHPFGQLSDHYGVEMTCEVLHSDADKTPPASSSC